MVWASVSSLVVAMPSFSRGDDLDRVEAENRDVRPPAAADRFAVTTSAYGVGGVFENSESVLLTELPDFFLLNGLAREMDRYDNFGETVMPTRIVKLGFKGWNAQVACGRVNVDEIDTRAPQYKAQLADATKANSVHVHRMSPVFQAKGETGNVQCAGSGVDGHCMAG
jgi:hypothetical protein